MKHSEETISGKDGVTLQLQTWLPEAGARAVVVVAHGYSEHIGRYAHVVKSLIGRGYGVFALDHRGHGRSEGERVNVESFDDFVEDLYLLVEKARIAFPDLPLFLIGHSMGALISLRYSLAHQEHLAGLVVSGAPLQIGDDVSPFLKEVGGFVATLLPSWPLIGGEGSRLSRDPEVQRRFDADPLTYKGKMKARMANELFQASLDTRDRIQYLSLPVLIMHGEADAAANVAGSIYLHDTVSSADKTLRLWPDAWHELFNELNKDEVIDCVLDWLDARVG